MIRSLILVFSLFLATVAFPSHASAATLQGTVVDPQSRPVSGARVTIATGTTVIATLTTRANGAFGPMELPDGDYDVAVTAPSLHALPQHVKVTGTIDLTSGGLLPPASTEAPPGRRVQVTGCSDRCRRTPVTEASVRRAEAFFVVGAEVRR